MTRPLHLLAGSNQLILTAALGLLWLLVTTAATAETSGPPHLIKNIHAGSDPRASRPSRFVPVGDVVFFAADDRDHGRELWRSDGTVAGTWLVKDLNSGPRDGITDRMWHPYETAVAGPDLYFFASDGADDDWRYRRLWRSDGTTAGTVQIDALPAAGVADFGGILISRANLPKQDALPSDELFRGLPQIEARWANAVGDKIFLAFRVLDTDDHELWVTNGTSAATRVATMNFVRTDGTIERLVSATDSLYYFVAIDPLAGIALWRSDGTAAGTRVVKDIRPASTASPFYIDCCQADPTPLFTTVHDTLFFVASDGVTSYQLWRSDGTEAGTVPLTNVAPELGGVFGCDDDTSSYCNPYFVAPVSAAGRAYYAFHTIERGLELWTSDGTRGGTSVVTALSPPGPNPPFVTLAGGDSLYFTLRPRDGNEQLWRSDGTPSGTKLIREFANVNEIQPHQNGAFFFADDGGGGYQPWWTDGTGPGTIKLRDVTLHENGSYPRDLTDLAGTLFFSANSEEHGRELWRSDASETGTVLVRDIRPGPEGSNPESFVISNGALFFSVDDGGAGRELWRSDGTADGTAMVADIAPGPAGSVPDRLTDVDGVLFFFADDGVHGRELWRSDGTADGTTMVRDVAPGGRGAGEFYTSADDGPYAVNAGGILLFAADDGARGLELWRSDGTASGTHLVAEIEPGPAGAYPHSFTVWNEVVFFVSPDSLGWPLLWRSDGTRDGTYLVRDPLGHAVRARRPIAVGRSLYALGDDGGHRLWVSGESTSRIQPVLAFEQSEIVDAAVVGESLFLQGGRRGPLWRIDCGGSLVSDVDQLRGSIDGMRSTAGRLPYMLGEERWHDLYEMHTVGANDGWYGTIQLHTLPPSSRQDRFDVYEYDAPSFTAAGTHLFFSGDFGHVGRELWALPLEWVPEVGMPDCGSQETPEPTPTEPPPTPTPPCGLEGDRSACTQIVIGSARGRAGDTVTIDVVLRAQAEPVAGTANDIVFSDHVRVAANGSGRPACKRNPAINKAVSTNFHPSGCTGRDCIRMRAVVLSLADVHPIPDGSVLYSCTVEISPEAAPGSSLLRIENVEAGSPDGVGVGVVGTSGTITVMRDAQHDQIGDGAVESDAAVVGDGCQMTRSAPPSPWLAVLLLLPLAFRRRSR